MKYLTVLVIILSFFLFPSVFAVTQDIQFSYTGYHMWYSNAPFAYPEVSYIDNGVNKTLTLKDTTQNVTVDLNSDWSTDNPFFGANEFWSVNNTGTTIIADEIIVISFSQYALCSDPNPQVNAAQGCIGSSTASVFDESIGMPMLFMMIDVILFIAIFARSGNMLLASEIFIFGAILTIANFSDGLLRIAFVAFLIGVAAVIVALLRRQGT